MSQPPSLRSSAPPDTVGKIARARAAARAEIAAFLAMVDASRAPAPLCASLVRVWHALASLEILLQASAPPTAQEFLASLASGDPPPLPAALGAVPPAFARKVVACATGEPWSAAQGPSDRDLDLHRRALLRARRTLDKRVRRIPGMGMSWRRVAWTIAVAVVLALSASAIAFAFYRPRWRVSYFANESLSGPPAHVGRVMEPDEDWGPGGPGSGVPADHFSARYESCLRMDEPGTVAFVMGSDDGSRLYVDDKLVIDSWSDHAYATTQQSIPLEKGVHALRLDYYERNGNARLTMAGRIESFHADFDSLLRVPAQGSSACR